MKSGTFESVDELSAEELARIGAALAAALPTVKPAPTGLTNLLVAVANPWVRALESFASLVDLPRELAQRILDRAQVGLDWVPGPLPGVTLVHFSGGPATVGADVGLVRLPPETEFPEHAHLGREAVLLLEGSYVDSAGYTLVAGQGEVREAGSGHAYRSGAHGVVLAVVLHEGIELPNPAGGAPIVLRA